MLSIQVRNVHEALPEGMHQIKERGVRRTSRNGPVMVLPFPFTTMYQHPKERVLFWPQRDANPFFHFFEALWMLAGQNDVETVAYFAKNMANYSDDGVTLHGAYGHRWRMHFGTDQLTTIANALKADRNCRRQVLQMWDCRVDLGRQGKDVPCNTQAYFQVSVHGGLDMMVSNRSNDLVWGAYGANAVHFSFLQEMMAAWIGVPVGAYWQVSMNTHLYLEPHEELMEALAMKAPNPPGLGPSSPYQAEEVHPFPLVSLGSVNRWQRELKAFLEYGPESDYDDPFFGGVAKPLLKAHAVYKTKSWGSAKELMRDCIATDWSRACYEWLDRRELAWKAKN